MEKGLVLTKNFAEALPHQRGTINSPASQKIQLLVLARLGESESVYIIEMVEPGQSFRNSVSGFQRALYEGRAGKTR